MVAPSSCPVSSATASKTARGSAPSATSVASRRSAACSSASRCRSSRAWVLEIAVATSSVNWPGGPRRRAGAGLARRPPAETTPQISPADDDRRADPGVDAGRSRGLADAAGDVGVVVDPRRAPGALTCAARLGPSSVQFVPVCEGVLADRADHGRRAVGLVARHLDEREVEQLRDLGGDGGEDVGRERALRDERRHAAQRRLLVGQPPELARAPACGRARSPRAR